MVLEDKVEEHVGKTVPHHASIHLKTLMGMFPQSQKGGGASSASS